MTSEPRRSETVTAPTDGHEHGVWRNPLVWRALVGGALGLCLLIWSQRSEIAIARLVGVGLVTVGVIASIGSMTSRPRRWAELATGLAATIAGVGIVGAGTESPDVVGRVAGAAMVIIAVRELYESRDPAHREDGTWLLVKVAGLFVGGWLLLSFPGTLLHAVLILVGLGLLAGAGLVVSIAVETTDDALGDSADSMRDVGAYVVDWLRDRPKLIDHRDTLVRSLYLEGSIRRTRFGRFATLMFLSSAISAFGVVTDSTATVIGAMLIAPLISPLMAMGLALMMGWPRRLYRSAIVALAGLGIAIGVGLVAGWTSPVVIDVALNSQIAARSSPTVLDLAIAVAAGAAGAYGLSRPDVSDSLPGVAIAIALVPPLSVVGIAYSQGEWEAGNGALLLFFTNAAAILLVGGATFVVTGVAPINRLADNQRRVRTATASLLVAAAIVVGGLLLNGAELTRTALVRSEVDAAVQTWLDDFDEHRVLAITLRPGEVVVEIGGPEVGRPDVDDLAPALIDILGADTQIEVRLTRELVDRPG